MLVVSSCVQRHTANPTSEQLQKACKPNAAHGLQRWVGGSLCQSYIFAVHFGIQSLRWGTVAIGFDSQHQARRVCYP